MRFFHLPPQDDLALRQQARAPVTGLRGVLPDAAWLHDTAREHGVDFATATFYEAVLAHPVHSAFVQQIMAMPEPLEVGCRAGSIMLVPGFVWEDYPELGADGQLIMQVAQRLGFDVHRVPVHGRGALSDNAERIIAALDSLTAKRSWLVTLSKGSADLGYALRSRREAIAWEKLAGWINVCGSPNGSDLATVIVDSPWRQLGARAMCCSSRIPFQALRELSTRHPIWEVPLALPAEFRVINVLGMPLRWHLTRALVARHRLLARHGPNDGVVLCANAFITPGLIYPLWGYDHYFRGPEIVPLLYRLFRWVQDEERAMRVPVMQQCGT